MFQKQDYNAKLSDFGLAKDGPVGDKSHVSTRIMGTYGYAAPEYIMTGRVTSEAGIQHSSIQKYSNVNQLSQNLQDTLTISYY